MHEHRKTENIKIETETGYRVSTELSLYRRRVRRYGHRDTETDSAKRNVVDMYRARACVRGRRGVGTAGCRDFGDVVRDVEMELYVLPSFSTICR